jgi:hypothetical protein
VTALVSVFIERHVDDFKQTPVSKVSSHWTYQAKPARKLRACKAAQASRNMRAADPQSHQQFNNNGRASGCGHCCNLLRTMRTVKRAPAQGDVREPGVTLQGDVREPGVTLQGDVREPGVTLRSGRDFPG